MATATKTTVPTVPHCAQGHRQRRLVPCSGSRPADHRGSRRCGVFLLDLGVAHGARSSMSSCGAEQYGGEYPQRARDGRQDCPRALVTSAHRHAAGAADCSPCREAQQWSPPFPTDFSHAVRSTRLPWDNWMPSIDGMFETALSIQSRFWRLPSIALESSTSDKCATGRFVPSTGAARLGLARRDLRFIAAPLLVPLAPGAAGADRLDKVTFNTDWRAQPEHGGFYQAVAAGIYARHGIDCDLRQGGPNLNIGQLLLAGRLDGMGIPMSNKLRGLHLCPANVGAPFYTIAAIFQKDPQVLIGHPGSGLDGFEKLKKAGPVADLRSGGRSTYWPYLAARSTGSATSSCSLLQFFNMAPFLAPTPAERSHRPAGLPCRRPEPFLDRARRWAAPPGACC